MTDLFTVVALIAAYNEEDIIEACLEHLHGQGIDSYLLDDGSTDRTIERAQAFVGRGLRGIERLPQTTPPTFSLDRILARKEALAQSLQASRFINQDADEFRDSLWSELDLRQAIERVDRLGWNAIDFEIFTIRPVGDPTTARADPLQPHAWYSPGAYYDRLQVRAWKRTTGPVDLRTTAGHDVMFEARSVFPLRFPMRHYPVRSQDQGVRKVFEERLPRFDPDERSRGWHVQYDDCAAEDLIVRRSSDLVPYDPLDARIRSTLHNRDLESAQAELLARTERRAPLQAYSTGNEFQRREKQLTNVIEEVRAEKAGLRKELDQLTERLRSANAQFESELANAHSQLAAAMDRARIDEARLEQEIRVRDADLGRLQTEVGGLQADIKWLQTQLEAVRGQLALIHASRSWRWTKPLRVALRLLGGS
jgi:hypothetical protein